MTIGAPAIFHISTRTESTCAAARQASSDTWDSCVRLLACEAIHFVDRSLSKTLSRPDSTADFDKDWRARVPTKFKPPASTCQNSFAKANVAPVLHSGGPVLLVEDSEDDAILMRDAFDDLGPAR